MTRLITGRGAIAKKNEPISPYLQRPLRSYEEEKREQADGKTQPVRGKPSTSGTSRDPAGEASRDEQNDR